MLTEVVARARALTMTAWVAIFLTTATTSALARPVQPVLVTVGRPAGRAGGS